MKMDIQYVNDSSGQTQAVLLPVREWKKLQNKVRKYEQMLKMKNTLTDAFEEVESIKKSRTKKQTLAEFLHEL